ncbi:MAG: hypothetical protein Q8K62_10850 [Thiobacillus sp.]|nr:hypothetical protein [Thiobacillus sp.]
MAAVGLVIDPFAGHGDADLGWLHAHRRSAPDWGGDGSFAALGRDEADRVLAHPASSAKPSDAK